MPFSTSTVNLDLTPVTIAGTSYYIVPQVELDKMMIEMHLMTMKMRRWTMSTERSVSPAMSINTAITTPEDEWLGEKKRKRDKDEESDGDDDEENINDNDDGEFTQGEEIDANTERRNSIFLPEDVKISRHNSIFSEEEAASLVSFPHPENLPGTPASLVTEEDEVAVAESKAMPEPAYFDIPTATGPISDVVEPVEDRSSSEEVAAIVVEKPAAVVKDKTPTLASYFRNASTQSEAAPVVTVATEIEKDSETIDDKPSRSDSPRRNSDALILYAPPRLYVPQQLSVSKQETPSAAEPEEPQVEESTETLEMHPSLNKTVEQLNEELLSRLLELQSNHEQQTFGHDAADNAQPLETTEMKPSALDTDVLELTPNVFVPNVTAQTSEKGNFIAASHSTEPRAQLLQDTKEPLTELSLGPAALGSYEPSLRDILNPHVKESAEPGLRNFFDSRSSSIDDSARVAIGDEGIQAEVVGARKSREASLSESSDIQNYIDELTSANSDSGINQREDSHIDVEVTEVDELDEMEFVVPETDKRDSMTILTGQPFLEDIEELDDEVSEDSKLDSNETVSDAVKSTERAETSGERDEKLSKVEPTVETSGTQDRCDEPLDSQANRAIEESEPHGINCCKKRSLTPYPMQFAERSFIMAEEDEDSTPKPIFRSNPFDDHTCAPLPAPLPEQVERKSSDPLGNHLPMEADESSDTVPAGETSTIKVTLLKDASKDNPERSFKTWQMFQQTQEASSAEPTESVETPKEQDPILPLSQFEIINPSPRKDTFDDIVPKFEATAAEIPPYASFEDSSSSPRSDSVDHEHSDCGSVSKSKNPFHGLREQFSVRGRSLRLKRSVSDKLFGRFMALESEGGDGSNSEAAQSPILHIPNVSEERERSRSPSTMRRIPVTSRTGSLRPTPQARASLMGVFPVERETSSPLPAAKKRNVTAPTGIKTKRSTHFL